jgi:quercetin dioxygenase-like cupin family protein
MSRVMKSPVHFVSIVLLSLAPMSVISQNHPDRKFTASPPKPVPLPAQTGDPCTQEILANSQVRVLRVDVPAGVSTQVGRHDHDFLIVSLGTNQFELAGPVNSIQFSMADGEVQVITGHWPHRIVNKSQQTAHIVEIEAKKGIAPERAICGLAAKSCTGSRFAFNDQTNYVESPLFDTPLLRLSKLEIQPGSGMPQHRDASDQLLIALNDQQLLNVILDDRTSNIDAHAGDVEWFSGGTVHRLANRGSQPAHFLTLELK